MSETELNSGAGDDRRGFFAKVFTWLGLGSLAASLAGTLYANFRFFFPKALYEPPSRFAAGLPGDYRPGTVSDQWVKDHQVWIVREDDRIYAMLAVCTHLGCLTTYFPGERLFKCPCHGSNFNLDGDPLSGPAPVPLYRLALSLQENGQIEVNKGRRANPIDRDEPDFVLKV